jgi:hypothetical protein
MNKTEIIEFIESLLNGQHNLTQQQITTLLKLKEQTLKSNRYIDLKIIGTELAKVLFHLFTEF